MLQGDVKIAFLSLSLSLSKKSIWENSLVRVVCGSMAREHPL